MLERSNLGHAPEHLEHLLACQGGHFGGDSHTILPGRQSQW
jgi:hypothetical protein